MQKLAIFFLVTLTTLIPCHVSAEEQIGGIAYSDIPKMAGMRPEWFTCNRSSDCGLFEVTCSWRLAAKLSYLKEAGDAYCAQTNGCVSGACPAPGNVIAVCEENQCMTKDADQ
jgi:hypothetical protein